MRGRTGQGGEGGGNGMFIFQSLDNLTAEKKLQHSQDGCAAEQETYFRYIYILNHSSVITHYEPFDEKLMVRT